MVSNSVLQRNNVDYIYLFEWSKHNRDVYARLEKNIESYFAKKNCQSQRNKPVDVQSW